MTLLSTKRVIGLPLLVALLGSFAAADTEIYKWVDEEGNVHYSDCPPPPSCDAEAVEAAPVPDPSDVRRAQQRLDEMLAEQEVSKAERDQERLERERRQILAMKLAVARKQVCIHARQNLHVLQIQRPVFYINERGEYVYLDEAVRQAEIRRMKALIAENCEPVAD